jgi:hypothetical protein
MRAVAPRSLLPLVFAGLAGLPSPAAAEMDAGPFAEGSIRISAKVGVAQQTVAKGEKYEDNTAFILGAGAGYYIVDGLELGLEGEYWINSEPSISIFSPGARYVLWFVPVLKPYAGAFYRHAFVGSPYDDIDSLGARFGAFWVSGGGSYFGGGAVYEYDVKGCRNDECGHWYPEIVLSFSF